MSYGFCYVRCPRIFIFLMKEPKIIIDHDGNENWETYQPEVALISMKEYIQIRFTKKTADAVNIYKRKSASESWEFIATAVNSPFDDHESEETWEYRIRGVRDSREVGLPVVLAYHSHNHSA